MLKILSLLIIMGVTSHALMESKIQQVMNTKVHQVLNVLKNPSLSKKQKEQKSIHIMDSVFDYDTMAMIAMGKRWKTLTTSQKKQFTKAFEKKIKHSYVDKLHLYNNQKVITKDLQKTKATRITLENHLIGKMDTYKVIYLFYKDKKRNQWYIYDVKLAGVSIIQTYRKQFASFLRTKTIKQLIDTL